MHPPDTGHEKSVALVSMPWMAPTMPSIQLATLAGALEEQGIASNSYELFLDYAAAIGLNLYKNLSSLPNALAEFIFSRHYYGPEHGDHLTSFLEHRPGFGLSSAELEDRVLEALHPVTERFLLDQLENIPWQHHDVIGFSLTIAQLASSMAMARLIKRRFPEKCIVFGGACCAGVMGDTILKICPYVDLVVRIEGEIVMPELVRAWRAGRGFSDLPGVSFRGAAGEIVSRPAVHLQDRPARRVPLNYDAYFERLRRLDLSEKLMVWLPFESSRGCWYGEKMQCTFCGLHDIMKYRSFEGDSVLAELEHLYSRYGIGRFFSVDLILPRSFLKTLLPEIHRRGHRWLIFYEVKANMSRADVEILANSGVRWIQPGIESLDRELLDLMKKGVSPLQNIQLLKWCREFDVRVSWNLICGLPRESPKSYRNMVKWIPLLSHLNPPSGAGQFQLHRFSPMFDEPESHGLVRLGALPIYRHVFPVAPELLDDLVYMHEFRPLEEPPKTISLKTLNRRIREWIAARARGAELSLHLRADGSATIHDTRRVPEPGQQHELDADETALYLLLDAALAEKTLAERFAQNHPDAARRLATRGGVGRTLRRFVRDGLVLREKNSVLALAAKRPSAVEPTADSSTFSAPLAYLEESMGNAMF